jgi:predicted site-specific integrase-resolvase
MSKWVMPGEASRIIGVSVQTLRAWDKAGTIPTKRSGGNTRLYDVSAYITETTPELKTICYCRVSSPKQKADLQRQIEYVTSKYPESEVIRDVGSGINFKRKGLNALLERAMCGEQLEVVVAYKDRLARFGYELIERIISRNGGRVVVLNEVSLSPSEELTQDLLTILHVFSCRLCGIRKYREKIKEESNITEDTSIPDADAEIII